MAGVGGRAGVAPARSRRRPALAGRPLLVVHGTEDDEVPAAAARALADAATEGPVELRIVPGAGHWLRADPRVVATLVGWLERQR